MTLPEQAARDTLTEQLFQEIRRLIDQGIWTRGDKLPGSRLIARDAKVSRTTALAAVEMAMAEGLVETRGRSGTYVAWNRSGSPVRRSQDDAPLERLEAIPTFTVGTPALDLFPLTVWRRLQARRWTSMPLAALGEEDDAGWPELRAAIATHVDASRGIKCLPEQVIVASSAQSAIHLAGLVLAEVGNAIWTEDPGYFGTRSALLALGARPVPVPVDAHGIDVERAMELAPEARLAVVTPSCQFPLGVRMSPERRRQLLAWARAKAAWIIEDDYDCEFPSGRSTPRPLAASGGLSRVIYINTFSKTLFPTLRLAYLIVPEELVDRFLAARRGVDRNTTVPNQMVLADFLNKGQFARHLRRCREAYRERRSAMVEALGRAFGSALTLPSEVHGLHICGALDPGIDDVAIAALARSRGIVVEPLSRFCAGEPTRRGLLLGYAAFTPEIIRRGVHALANAVAPALARGAD